MICSYHPLTGEVLSINSAVADYPTITIDHKKDLANPGYLEWEPFDNDNYVVVGGNIKVRPKSEISDRKLIKKKRNLQFLFKTKCREHIIRHYPIEIQSSMSLGIYPDSETIAMKNFIANCIEEENRVFDEIELATNDEQLDRITPIFPEA